MMVGDASNDPQAIRTVGIPVAMGNAEPESSPWRTTAWAT